MRRMYPNDPSQRASHETIYTALYAMPRGELRRDLIACLRQGNDARTHAHVAQTGVAAFPRCRACTFARRKSPTV